MATRRFRDCLYRVGGDGTWTLIGPVGQEEKAEDEKVPREEPRRDPFPALAAPPVDLKDGMYRFLRAVDGDTLVVLPPPELKGWLMDIHVRLYGLETPELWAPHGREYRDYLQQLCEIDAKSSLYVLWERRSLRDRYSGFPRSSFQRGIGHVFLPSPGGQFVYVNGVMHLLPLSSFTRNKRSLLRGGAMVPALPRHLAPTECARTLRLDPAATSPTMSRLLGMSPPRCLITFDRLPTLDPRMPEFVANAKELHSHRPACPISYWLRETHSPQFYRNLVDQKLSAFDAVLRALRVWSRMAGGLNRGTAANSPNQTVQRTGASRSAQEPNRTSPAAGSRR
jgi:hypothetical protein